MLVLVEESDFVFCIGAAPDCIRASPIKYININIYF